MTSQSRARGNGGRYFNAAAARYYCDRFFFFARAFLNDNDDDNIIMCGGMKMKSGTIEARTFMSWLVFMA